MPLQPQPLVLQFSENPCYTGRMKHGLAKRSEQHPLYWTWKNMRQRCMNPRVPHFKYYGGRGIKICKRWDDFAVFVADIGERPPGMTLDRRNNNGHYTPTNVRWITRAEQSRNRRDFITANETKTHCKNGHPFDEQNTRIIDVPGRYQRQCKACDRDRKRSQRAA